MSAIRDRFIKEGSYNYDWDFKDVTEEIENGSKLYTSKEYFLNSMYEITKIIYKYNKSKSFFIEPHS